MALYAEVGGHCDGCGDDLGEFDHVYCDVCAGRRRVRGARAIGDERLDPLQRAVDRWRAELRRMVLQSSLIPDPRIEVLERCIRDAEMILPPKPLPEAPLIEMAGRAG